MKRIAEKQWRIAALFLLHRIRISILQCKCCRKNNFAVIGIDEKKTQEWLRNEYAKFIELP